MAEESIIPKEIKDLVGVEMEPEVFEIEKGHIRRYAEAVGDPNPLWRDEVHACKSRYGNMIGPPLFHLDEPLGRLVDKLLQTFDDIKYPLKGFLNAGMEVESYKPMMAGDVIIGVAKLAEVYEKQGKTGKYLFITCEATITNRRKELVAITRHTFVKL
jgi:acyl dehydratase